MFESGTDKDQHLYIRGVDFGCQFTGSVEKVFLYTVTQNPAEKPGLD